MAIAFLMTNVQVDVQSNTNNSTSITGISKASEAVVECTGANFAVNDVVVVESVGGMFQINNITARVKSKTAANVTLESVDSSAFSTFTTGGTIKRISAWESLQRATNFNMAEPQPEKSTIRTIHSLESTEMLGVTSPAAVDMNIYADPFASDVVELRKAAKAQTTRAFRVTFANGYKLYFNALVSGGRGIQGESGQPATGSLNLSLQGSETWYQS